MSSPKQIDANRGNARLSNGPKTVDGKAASSKNAMKHGLLSKDTLLPNEDAEAFDDLAEGLRAALAPVGRLETELAERIISQTWRLRRMGKAEQAILAWQQFEVWGMKEVAEEEAAEKHADEKKEAEMKTAEDELPNSFDAETQAMLDEMDRQNRDHPIVRANKNATRMAREVGFTDVVSFGVAVKESEDSLTKLSRYETSIERSLYKALHELQRLQASRKGQPVPVPVAVDIDLTGLAEPKDIEERYSPLE